MTLSVNVVPLNTKHFLRASVHQSSRHVRTHIKEQRSWQLLLLFWQHKACCPFCASLDNTVTVSRSAAGALLVNGDAVTILGSTPTIANTNQMQVFGLAGNDQLLINEANGALPQANLFGSSGDDGLTSGSANDLLFGQASNDTLLGKGGNDLLFCGDSNDVLTGDDGDDQMFGEAGNDRLNLEPR